jgi:hypothetical protein
VELALRALTGPRYIFVSKLPGLLLALAHLKQSLQCLLPEHGICSVYGSYPSHARDWFQIPD